MDKIIKEKKFSSNLVPIFVMKKLTFRKCVTVELLDSKMMKIQINQWTWWIPNYPWQIQQKNCDSSINEIQRLCWTSWKLSFLALCLTKSSFYPLISSMFICFGGNQTLQVFQMQINPTLQVFYFV